MGKHNLILGAVALPEFLDFEGKGTPKVERG